MLVVNEEKIASSGFCRLSHEASRDEVIGEWRGLHNEKLYNILQYALLTKLYLSDQIKKENGGSCSTHGETERGIPAFNAET